MEWGGFWATLRGGNADQDVCWCRLGILNHDIEVAVFSENTRVYQLVLEFLAAATPIGLCQVRVGEGALWVFVERLHIRVGWSVIQKEIILFHIFAMIAQIGRASCRERV